MWIVAGAVVVVIVVLGAALALLRRRSRRSTSAAAAAAAEPVPEVHALDDALRTVESLTDAKGSSLLDQVDRDGRTIRDRLASGEAHLDALRQPDDTGPLLRRVLDEVVGTEPAEANLAPPPPPTTASTPPPPPPPAPPPI